MQKFRELLFELGSCRSAIDWAKDMEIVEIVEKCHRGDWLLWLAAKIKIDYRKITLAKALCAKTVIHLMKDKRSINAVNVAESFGNGEINIEELSIAYAADAAAAYADAAAYAAADAAAYAAYAAVYAADAAAYAAYAAAYAADADAAAAAAAAKKENQLKTANICREILGDLIINRVNELY